MTTARKNLCITMSTGGWERCVLNIFVPFVLFVDYAFLSSACVTSELLKVLEEVVDPELSVLFIDIVRHRPQDIELSLCIDDDLGDDLFADIAGVGALGWNSKGIK